MTYRKVTIGELCTIVKGTTGIQKAIPGKYPLVVTSEERKSSRDYQFDEEAVIIPLVSSTGHGRRSLNRIHFQRGKFALGSILCAVIPKDKSILNAEYLYRYLDLNKERELVSRMRGMANVTLPIKEIEAIEIPLPSLAEQERFIESFQMLESRNSRLFSELAHQLDLVKQLRLAFLREAVQGQLVNQEPNDEPATELLKKIQSEKERLIRTKKIKKDRELRPIRSKDIPFSVPENWTWCRLGDVLTEIKYGTSQSCDYNPNQNSPVLRIPNVSSGVLNGEDMKYTNLSNREINELALEENDILIIRSNGSRELVGRTVLVTSEFAGYAYAGYLVRLRFNKILSVPRYLRFVTISPFFRELIETPLRTTVGINNINTEEMSNLLVPLPPLPEQYRIAAKLDHLMLSCDQLEQSIKLSQKQNEQVLQQVLMEALRPKVLRKVNELSLATKT